MTPEQYIRWGSRLVKGWLEPEAAVMIAALARSQSISGSVGEIGIHHGKLFILLNLLRRNEEAAVAMDLFENQEGNLDGSGRGDRAIFERHLTRFSPGGTVQIRAVDSTTVDSGDLRRWGNGPFRLFSVDGGHTASTTESDLKLAANILAPGGLIILDDYFNVGWPAVSEGTNKFLYDDPQVVPVGSAHNKTYFSDKASAPGYRSVMRQVAREHGWRVSEQAFHGEPHVVCWTLHGRDRLSEATRATVRRIPGGTTLVRRVRGFRGK